MLRIFSTEGPIRHVFKIIYMAKKQTVRRSGKNT
jgi:hypothetical protein